MSRKIKAPFKGTVSLFGIKPNVNVMKKSERTLHVIGGPGPTVRPVIEVVSTKRDRHITWRSGPMPRGSDIYVKSGDRVKKGEVLAMYPKPLDLGLVEEKPKKDKERMSFEERSIYAINAGVIGIESLTMGINVVQTATGEMRVIKSTLPLPFITISTVVDPAGRDRHIVKRNTKPLPVGTRIKAMIGDKVLRGDVLAILPDDKAVVKKIKQERRKDTSSRNMLVDVLKILTKKGRGKKNEFASDDGLKALPADEVKRNVSRLELIRHSIRSGISLGAAREQVPIIECRALFQAANGSIENNIRFRYFASRGIFRIDCGQSVLHIARLPCPVKPNRPWIVMDGTALKGVTFKSPHDAYLWAVSAIWNHQD